MQGIYTMAQITTALGMLICGLTLWHFTEREDRRMAMLVAALALPLSVATFYLVRVPLISLVNGVLHLDPESVTALIVQFLYAPITEEPAKLLPILLPLLRKRLTAKNAVSFGAASGIGFGIGEIWLIALQVAAAPQFEGMAWYLFTGFLFERLTVLATHAFFTAAAVRGIAMGRPVLGLLAAMLLHLLGNAPIALIALDVGGLGEPAWRSLVSLWVSLYSVIGIIVMLMWRYGPIPKAAHTHARCPECDRVYPRPVLVMNLPKKRYERCPNCNHWHWIERWADPDVPVTDSQ
jgi:RsiW-degrading membrane proteinase PrsW (M82 family)